MQVIKCSSIFEVDYINELNITQNNTINLLMNVVANCANFAYYMLTAASCNDDESNQICMIKFKLYASLFIQLNPEFLNVSVDVQLAIKNVYCR